jgi:hypothetical protein
VAGLTAAALAVVGFLAYQASANASGKPVEDRPGSSDSAAPDPSKGPNDKETTERAPVAVPADSGSGLRVVYSLSDRRVWLVGADEQPTRTYQVTPSNVSPPLGRYQVTSRSAQITGSDGVPVEHVVRFSSFEGVVIGFSAAVDGSTPEPDPAAGRRTGGIREAREDGAALWTFARIGTTVVVVT